MAKRATLGDFTSAKPSATIAAAVSAAPVAEVEAERKVDNRERISLRLGSAPMRQLKQIGLDEGVAVHDLLIEALDDLFAKRGKARIATDEQPRLKAKR